MWRLLKLLCEFLIHHLHLGEKEQSGEIIDVPIDVVSRDGNARREESGMPKIIRGNSGTRLRMAKGMTSTLALQTM